MGCQWTVNCLLGSVAASIILCQVLSPCPNVQHKFSWKKKDLRQVKIFRKVKVKEINLLTKCDILIPKGFVPFVHHLVPTLSRYYHRKCWKIQVKYQQNNYGVHWSVLSLPKWVSVAQVKAAPCWLVLRGQTSITASTGSCLPWATHASRQGQRLAGEKGDNILLWSRPGVTFSQTCMQRFALLYLHYLDSIKGCLFS